MFLSHMASTTFSNFSKISLKNGSRKILGLYAKNSKSKNTTKYYYVFLTLDIKANKIVIQF